MCSTCGCGSPEDEVSIRLPGEESDTLSAAGHSLLINAQSGRHRTPHGLSHSHRHDHHHSHEIHIDLEKNILHENDLLAQRNRGFLNAKSVFSLNLVSSPGSGKTTILERTIENLQDVPLAIIEGDQQSMNDANRIAATGAPVVQVNTGKGCHLDAHMVMHAMQRLQLQPGSILFIENVGNLVCPALFDLGESTRVVIGSVTEGDDKPVKYPYMFQSAQVCIINKTDLLPYVSFSIDTFKAHALHLNPGLQFFEVSATRGDGLDLWIAWLKSQIIKTALV